MKRNLAQILQQREVLTVAQVEQARAYSDEKGLSFARAVVKLKLAREVEVLRAWAELIGLPFSETLPDENIDPLLLNQVPIQFAKRALLFPYAREDGLVKVATGNPLEVSALDDLRQMLGAELELLVMPPSEVVNAINLAYDRASESQAEDVMDDLEKTETIEDINLEDEIRDIIDSDDEAPIIRLVNSLLYKAIKQRASDIHIEPFENEMAVRFRIDGVLYEIIKPAKRFQQSIISRVKIMAKLNIAEKRLPQDGRIRIKIAGKDIDIRTSVIPTAHGERVVMRLLDKSAVHLDLTDLGMLGDTLKEFAKLIRKSHGILLVTGPTGSGKTTTLYAAITTLNKPDVNILTIEDPIEYEVKGIGQMQVNPKIELTFSSGLRHFLRQDPDIILVGEIRDVETAEIAVQASLTGHLVLSTLHTNDASGAITRLLDMGVEQFLVSSSVIGIIAQRLVRVLCPDCREAYKPEPGEIANLGLKPEQVGDAQFYRPTGCEECMGTGFRGRTGIYEQLVIDDQLRRMVMSNVDSSTIKRTAIQNGMHTLRDDGARKVLSGITSVSEVLRVTQEDLL
ncbi:MAG: type II secretion system ATPase GspE [Candidatus Alcyoniella australis]|nr:type II secretion system ATPase GspE [Candidatus Alcyoniella australis]